MANRKALHPLLALVARIPGVYPLLAFVTARRVLVQGWSMCPALRPGDRVLFDRLAYALRRPCAGDIVLARHPARPGLRMIKRIAAVPGEKFALEDRTQIVLGEEEYALVGDSPEMSTDSRQLGPVRARDIAARAWIVFWPAERFRRL